MKNIKQIVHQFVEEKIIAPFQEDEVNTAIEQWAISVEKENAELRKALALCNSQQPSASATPQS